MSNTPEVVASAVAAGAWVVVLVEAGNNARSGWMEDA
jgi:hypothetical protein